MLSFGQRGWLMGYRNRLWTMSDIAEESVDYCDDWPHTVKRFVLYMDWERSSISGRLFEKRRYLDFITFALIYDATHLLLRLQQWFLTTSARRKARRLALAMSLHARLGQDSLLAALDTDIVRALILAAT